MDRETTIIRKNFPIGHFLPSHKIGPLLGTWFTDYPQRILFILTVKGKGGGNNQEGILGLKWTTSKHVGAQLR